MSDLEFKIDSSAFESVLEDFRKDLQRELSTSIQNLADMTFEKTLELAGQKLHSTLSIYKDSLTSRKEGVGIYVVSLDSKALFIEEGLPENFDMKPGLLKKGKSGKAGHRYAVIPFKHNKSPSKQPLKAQEITAELKKVLKKENIPFSKIEKNAAGSPRIGLLHKIDIDSAKPTAKASTPALKGVRIYQTQDEKGKVSRGIYTFRTVTDGPKSANKFIHPGLSAGRFLDYAFEWAMSTFDNEIMPELLKKWSNK